jgi:hypothetical protein
MDSSTDKKADCYSAGERGWMLWTQELRANCLRPFLALLATGRVHPDHVTFASLLVGLAFCPLYFYSREAALVAILLQGPFPICGNDDSKLAANGI